MTKMFAFPLGVALAAAGLAAGMALGGSARTVTVKSAYVPSLGKTVLVTSSGLTLYRNTGERGGHVRCTGSCAATWPPLLVAAGDRLAAGTGVRQAKLGTVKRPDGRRQATYSGSPLYRYAGDRKRGDAKGQGFGGIWFSLAVAGAAAPATTAPATTSPPQSTDTGGYGY